MWICRFLSYVSHLNCSYTCHSCSYMCYMFPAKHCAFFMPFIQFDLRLDRLDGPEIPFKYHIFTLKCDIEYNWRIPMFPSRVKRNVEFTVCVCVVMTVFLNECKFCQIASSSILWNYFTTTIRSWDYCCCFFNWDLIANARKLNNKWPSTVTDTPFRKTKFQPILSKQLNLIVSKLTFHWWEVYWNTTIGCQLELEFSSSMIRWNKFHF